MFALVEPLPINEMASGTAAGCAQDARANAELASLLLPPGTQPLVAPNAAPNGLYSATTMPQPNATADVVSDAALSSFNGARALLLGCSCARVP